MTGPALLLLAGLAHAGAAEDLATAQERVARLRGLPFAHPVALRLEDEDTMREVMRADLDESWPRDEALATERVLRFLRMLPDRYDLRGALEDLLGDGVAGYYDPETEDLVVVRRPDTLAFEAPVLEHELAHALHDQHFGLWNLTHREEIDDDAALAVRALVEGDATFLMLHTMGEALGLSPDHPGVASALLAMGQVSASTPGELVGTPAIVARTLVFPYVEGTAMVAHLYDEGGWAAVNGAWGEDLPLSTEQVLHPDKLSGPGRDLPTVVALPDLSAALGPGWAPLDDTTVGELGIQVLLADHGLPDPVEAAAGWDGDTLAAWALGDAVAIAWASTWDAEVDAAAFAADLRFVAARLAGTARVERHGRDVLLVVAPGRARARRVAAKAWKGWTTREVSGLDDLSEPPPPRPSGPVVPNPGPP